jgi:zinc protease
MKKTFFCLLISLLGYFPFAQNLKIPIPNNPSVKVGTLKNGLKYYILKNEKPAKRMELRLVVNAGSILESDQQQGLAHFVEHMNFNGTKNFPKNDLVDFLQKSGMKFGADLNASTSFDETIYQLQVPTDSAKLFERSFQILADWAHYATLDTAEINKERGIIIEEERARGKNAQSRMQVKLLPLIFNNSRYADRIPIGKVDILKTFKPTLLTKFYNDWYRPDLMAVVAVGDFEPAQVEKLIKDKFAKIPANLKGPKRIVYPIAAQKGIKTAILLDKEFPQTVVQIVTKMPSEKVKTQDNFRNTIANNLYNQMIGSRLQEATKKPNAPFVYAIMNYSPFMANLDAFVNVVLPKSADGLEAAVKGIIDEQNRLKKFGFTQGELDRAKKDFFESTEKAYKEKDKTQSAAFVGSLIQNYLHGTAYENADFRYEFSKKQLDGITLKDISAVIQKTIKEDNRVGILMGSEKDKDKYPSEAKLAEWIKYNNPDLKPYEDDAVTTPILDKIPDGTKVIAENKVESVGITELTLANGIKIALKPTDFKNDQILFSATSKGGNSLYSDSDYFSAMFASYLVSQGGVGKLTETQLDKSLAGKSAQVYTYIDDLTEGIGGSTSPKDLETALQLIYAHITLPRRDDEVIKVGLKNQKDLIANSLKTLTPEKVFSDSINAILYQKNMRRLSLKPEDIDKINIDKAMEVYKDRFSDMSDFTFVFVGNFDVKKITPLLEKYIGGLPSTKRMESFKDLKINKVKGNIEKTIYKGLEDKAVVKLQFNGDYGYTEEENVNLDALSEVLEIKLLEKLREEAGGVYTPNIYSSSEKFPTPTYNLSIDFGCAPANVEKLIKMTLDEIEKIKTNGPEKIDVEKVIAEEKRSTEIQFKENGFWNAYLIDQYSKGEDLNYINRFSKELIDKISVDSIKKAANQFCKDNLARFVLLPEKK